MAETQKAPSLCCNICDSDIPADPMTKPGDILYCSYCKIGLKVIKTKDGGLKLDFEDEA